MVKLSTKEKEHQQFVCERVTKKKRKGKKKEGRELGEEGGRGEEGVPVFFHITERGLVRVSPEMGDMGLREVLERAGEGWEGEKEIVCGESTDFVGKKERFSQVSGGGCLIVVIALLVEFWKPFLTFVLLSFFLFPCPSLLSFASPQTKEAYLLSPSTKKIQPPHSAV